MQKTILLALVLSVIVPSIGADQMTEAHLLTVNHQVTWKPEPAGAEKIAAGVQEAMASLQTGEMLPVIVTLRAQADLTQIGGPDRSARLKGVIRALQATAEAAQRPIRALLETRRAQGLVVQATYFWVFDGLAVTATPEVIQELAARPEVLTITPDEISIVPASPSALGVPEVNLSLINAPELWGLGWTGQGVVVANMDSGVDVSHPDLATRWRGGTNSWYDPYGQHPTTPTDLSGHGTWTMGVTVGGNAGGTLIGVAPGAQWIAVKIFNDAGSATATAIHQGFQWLLDPDDDPNSADAPHVVNNSWTYAYPGCYLEFELDLQSLRAAGILPVFAAGNGGPGAATSYSPANNPSAFAVGATDNSDLIYAYSSRGPSSCGEPTSIFPELVAPGVAIHTTDLSNGYYDGTGTSLAAPHAAGSLALLLNAYPNLSAADQQAALINGALDLGIAGPDNDFGYGRLDVHAGYQWLTGVPPATPTPTATPIPSGNLALNKPVTVSSFKDSSHEGSAAVDGDIATSWQTAKAVGKNKLPSEWITVDLGGSMSLSRVVLEWDAYFATSYTIGVSADNNTWVTVFSTLNGDGANDSIVFSPVQARYVRLDSTAWNSSSLRNRLREFEIYGSGSGPSPTVTPTPTATPGSGTTMHVGDLDGASSFVRNRWSATVVITVHDASESPVVGATVNGTWSNVASGSDVCTADNNGVCSITKRNIKGTVSSVTFTVNTVSHASMLFEPSANHDPDGDSSGTSITIVKP